MDKQNDCKNNDYSYLRRLPIDRLLELLAVAPALSDTPEDEAYMSALEEAIIEKENEHPTGFLPDVDQRWEQFQALYMPDEDEAALGPEHMPSACPEGTGRHSFDDPPARSVRRRQVRRTVLIAAAAIACAFGVMVTAQAAGIDVFGAMARWTQDAFSFGRIAPDSVVSECPKDETEDALLDPRQEFSTLQAALDAYGMTEVHEPRWLPEGYAVHKVGAGYSNASHSVIFYSTFENDEDFISISIMSHEGAPDIQTEKTDVSIEKTERDGITFYLIENVNSQAVAWHAGGYEYYISGKLGTEILWKIAESMFE